MKEAGRIHVKPHCGGELDHFAVMFVGEEGIWVGVDEKVHAGSELFKREGRFIIDGNEPVGIRCGDECCRWVTELLDEGKSGKHFFTQYRVDLVRLWNLDADFYHCLEFIRVQ